MDMNFNVNDRRLIDGPVNDLMMISPVKHAWAIPLYERMFDNTWHPNKVGMAKDIKDYRGTSDYPLEGKEKRVYDMSLAFVSNLDGIQFNSLTYNIGQFITSPEVKMCISRQAWEESLHVLAYSKMIEAITDDPLSVYTLFARDEVLAGKNQHIIKQSKLLGKGYSPRNFAMAVVANVILEGLYFFNAFANFYILSRNGKMHNTADQIRYIQKDEETHLDLFINMWHTLRAERPELFTPELIADALELADNAMQLESTWGMHMIDGGMPGSTDGTVLDFTKVRANECLNALGLPVLYPGVENPYPWFDKFSRGLEKNFFETKVVDYQAGGGALEW